jgi:molybdopterin-guanine dinucleotide biosynthesis protein A
MPRRQTGELQLPKRGKIRPPAMILAGGQARRMGGGDKALLPLGDGVLLDAVIARLAPQAAPLALSANGDPARFVRFGLPVLPDALPNFPGPLAGLLSAMDWAAGQGVADVVTVAVDTPFFPADLVARLQAARGAEPIVLASCAGVLHPTFGLWAVALRDDLGTALAAGERKLRLWAGRHGYATADFAGAGQDPFFNINTPDDLARAEALLRP